jgi:hypothetical protein
MSTSIPASASPTVVRSHSTSSRPHAHRPPASDLPHRTRSVAVRPSTSSHSYQSQHSNHSYSKSQSHDRRPPSNQAAFDNIARRDFEGSRGTHSSSSRRDHSKERSRERPTSAHRTDSSPNKHRRNLSVQSHQRDSIDMASAGPVVAEPAPAPTQAASGSHLHPSSSVQPKRRTTITTPSGQWALGKTIGAGSMGKVKLAKNMETSEQVFSNGSTDLTLTLISIAGRCKNSTETIGRRTPQLARHRESRPLEGDPNCP